MDIDFSWLEQRIFHRTLHPDEKAKLAETIQTFEFQPGESVLVQNEPGGALHLFYRGRAEVRLQFCGMEVLLSDIGEGAQVGDMSMIDDMYASTCMRIIDPCLTYKINRDALSKMLRVRHEIARDMLLGAIQNMADVREMPDLGRTIKKSLH